MMLEKRYSEALEKLRPILLDLPEEKKRELQETNEFEMLVEKLEKFVEEMTRKE